MFCRRIKVTKSINSISSLILITAIIFFSFQFSIASDIDDGYTDAERTAIYSQSTISNFAATNQEYYRGNIIVDSTKPNAYFGLYRFSQMTDPGWNLFRNTIDWSINYQSHATAKICFAGFRSVPTSQSEDALAAYNFLIDSMNFDSAHIDFMGGDSLVIADFSSYSLVLNVGFAIAFSGGGSNIISQDVPFITSNTHLATAMGICNNEWGWFHESRDFVIVKDNNHYITAMYDTGQLIFADKMWMDALYATGNGVVLVTADEEQILPPIDVSISSHDPYTNIGEVNHVSINYGDGSGLAPFETSGFDLLVSYDSERLSVNSVTQGALLDSCQWEYFTYSIDSEADCGSVPCPDGTIRIVALANDLNSIGTPLCNLSSYGTLIDIEFQVTTNPAMECSSAPIYFYWYDCGDNTFSSAMGDTLFISQNKVNSFPPQEIDTTFPTSDGAIDECLTEDGLTQRGINFKSSGIFIKGCVYEPPNDRGDINLNYVHYEIADAVLFHNYLIFGSNIFTVDIEQQTNATDVNDDGRTLTLEDYVYLWRIITGDALPFPSPPNISAQDTILFTQDTINKTVSFSYPDSLSAVYLIFEGDLRPWGWGDDTADAPFPYDGIHTRVLIQKFFNDTTVFSHDSLFFYTGEGKLVGAFASYDGINSIPTAISGGTGSCCTNRGNVDGDSSGLLDISDLVALVSYVFDSGVAPSCFDEADITTDWSIDIADVVFLVDLMFTNGPPPLPCQ